MTTDPTLPTPVARDHKGRGRPGQLGTVLLPTPPATDGDKGSPRQRSSSGAPLLPGAVLNLMPTPTAALGGGGQKSRGGDRADELLLSGLAETLLPTPTAVQYGYNQSVSSGAAKRPSLNTLASHDVDWGKYEAAVRRWETTLGRPAPEPTEIGPRGNRRLSPRFVEWMMGLSEGWVTEFDFPRKHAFRLLGNGVVRQQAALALAGLLYDYAQLHEEDMPEAA